jgi:hypothetical protein
MPGGGLQAIEKLHPGFICMRQRVISRQVDFMIGIGFIPPG